MSKDGDWLHLGCGPIHCDPPWINIDTRMQPGVDHVDNIGILKRWQPESVDKIYCCHALNHFTRWDYPRVLKMWHQILQRGGELMISVIDFAGIVELYHERSTPMPKLIGLLTAAQDYETNVRHMHWDKTSLTCDLVEAGFPQFDICEFTPFVNGDCSSAVMDGVPISLNLKATKAL